MAQPGVWEVDICVRVAFLAGIEHVRLDLQTLFGVINLRDIMHAMAVITYRFIGLLVRR